MIQQDFFVDVPISILQMEHFSPEDCLFFDIETTGLSWKRSHLYLLGAVFFSNGTWIHRQWFCQKPSEESQVLLAFSELLKQKKLLFHYNGTTFDVPYLMHKYTFYQIPVSWDHLQQIDLYRYFQPIKSIVSLEHMHQKDLECCIGLHREDAYSGGELIQVYKDYLSSADSELLHILCLHNKEDVEGMLALLSLFLVRKLWIGAYEGPVSAALSDQNSFVLTLPLSDALPITFSKKTSYGSIQAEHHQIQICITMDTDPKKYFYPNYRDYYYLPLEDEAIHKSVGAYVDPTHRKKATADTCYKIVTGSFLPQYGELFSPAFSIQRKDHTHWFLFTDEFLQDTDALLRYANHLLTLLSK